MVVPVPCLLDIIALFHRGKRRRKAKSRRKKVGDAVMKNTRISLNLSVVCQGITMKYLLCIQEQ